MRNRFFLCSYILIPSLYKTNPAKLIRLFVLSSSLLVLATGIFAAMFLTYAQPAVATIEVGGVSKVIIHQPAQPSREITKVSGLFQSYVDDINPTVLATRLSPMLLIFGVSFIALSGLTLIFQSKKLALSMLTTGIGCTVFGLVPSLLIPIVALFKTIPIWLSVVVAFFISLSVLGAFAAIFIGKAAAASMVGNLAAWVIQKILLLFILPFSVLRRLFSDNSTP